MALGTVNKTSLTKATTTCAATLNLHCTSIMDYRYIGDHGSDYRGRQLCYYASLDG
jgi:hypothetical protein